MVGSGVNADNIAVFYKEGIRHFHLSASELIKISDNMYKNILFDELEYKYKSAVYEKVRQAKRRIESLVCG
jgi:copper homeostasis protein CutC